MASVVEQLKYLFMPKSVAIIGASRYPGKIGHEILRNLIEYCFEGKIYPINPTAEKILGLKVYPTILDVSDEVDLAVIAIPAHKVPHVLEECGEKGVKTSAIVSSGFGEIGNIELERKVLEIARKYGIRVLGPNIMGVVYTHSKLNASFGPRDVVKGNIAFLSQSGALGIALIGWTITEEIGLSAVVSLGNKVDIDDADLLEFFYEDENTKVITIYMEGLRDGKKFMKVAAKVTKKKPVIVLKSGRSVRGAKAAASHTGSLAGADKIFDAAFKQTGILRAITFEDMFDWARALATQPPIKTNKAVIITNGGGAGVMAADAAEEYGVNILEPSPKLMETFRKYMPEFGSPKNPVDLTGHADAETYYEVMKTAFESKEVGAIIVLYCKTPVLNPMDMAKAVVDAVKDAKESGYVKPIVVNMLGGEDTIKASKELNRKGIPSYPIPERAVKTLGAIIKWSKWAGYLK